MSWAAGAVGAPTCEPQVCDCGQNASHDSIVDSRLYSAILAVVCILSASMASGMSVGFSSMDQYELQVLIATNENDCQSVEEKATLLEERRIAKLILPTLKEGNRLLVTFVIVTAVANEALPLFLDQLFPEWIACLLSVSLVIFVCEILPALMFRRGPRQMQMSAYMIPLVKFLMVVLAPVARPVAYLLDLFVRPGEGETNIKYTRAQMNAMLNMHVVCNDTERSSESSTTAGGGLAKKEVHAIRTIISSRVIWRTMYKVQIVHADSIFRGFQEHIVRRGGSAPGSPQGLTIGFDSLWKDGDERDDHLLVKDASGLIGSISVADLAAEHTRHGDRPIREFKLRRLVFLDTSVDDPALFDVLCGMIKSDSNFSICGSSANPEGFVTLKSIVAQLVCDNDRMQTRQTQRDSFGSSRRESSMSSGPDASQLKQLQNFALKKMSTIENFMSDDSDNDGTDEAEDEYPAAVPEAVKKRLLERRHMFSQIMD